MYKSYWRTSVSLGLATIFIIADTREQALDFALAHDLEWMYEHTTIDRIIDIRTDAGGH